MFTNRSALSELKQLVTLATPVSLAQLSMVGMSATDVLIAGNAGTVELAGMNLGVNAWNMIIFFFMGVGFATQPLVAKHFGAQSYAGVKHQLHQSIWMCLWLGCMATLIVWCGVWCLKFANFEADLLAVARQYLLVISLCTIPMVLIPALRGMLEGINLTRVVFIINFTAFLVNIPLDYALVNGLYGLPKLGGVGCAWATVALMWCSFIGFFAVIKWHKSLKHKRLLHHFEKPNVLAIKRTLAIGVPIGVSIVVELAMFSGAGMMIASFGAIEAGAHAVAITVASLSFMLYMGLAQGVTIRASQFLGADRPDAAWFTIKVGSYFNMLMALVICVAFILFTEPLIRLFSNDDDVINVAVTLLYFGAAFQLADCLQVAMVHALRAYHDTRSPPKYQLIAFWGVGLPLGVLLSFSGWWPSLSGARGMWLAMVVSLTLVGFMLLRRLLIHRRQTLAALSNAL